MYHDQSSKYFINGTKYNCPFCKTSNVKYNVEKKGDFFWDNDKQVYFYIIKCTLCRKSSFHLSYHDIEITINQRTQENEFHLKPMKRDYSQEGICEIKDRKSGEVMTEYDHLFFYHRPLPKLKINDKIPTKIKKLIIEAEECVNLGYLTGASACIRKAIYMLLKENGIQEHDDKLVNLSYEKRLDLLKSKCTNVQSYLIDTLKNIKSISSQELHENDCPNLNIKDVNLLKEALIIILTRIYVIPDRQQKNKQKIQMQIENSLKKANNEN